MNQQQAFIRFLKTFPDSEMRFDYVHDRMKAKFIIEEWGLVFVFCDGRFKKVREYSGEEDYTQ